MKKYFTKKYFPAIIGTAIEYYDVSLYGYMAPILIQVFLPNIDKLKAYFYYFSFEILAALFQILGANFFGKIGDRDGRKRALYLSSIGTSVITFAIAVIPTFDNIGIFAAIIFISCRAMQSFFLGGEFNGGAIYCLEHEEDNKKHFIVSGLYGASTVLGVLLASAVATIIVYIGKEYFRLAYCLSLFFAFVSFFLRRNMLETPEFLSKIEFNNSSKSNIMHHFKIFIAIAFVSILIGILYGFPTRIFNVLIPLVSNISTLDIMIINTIMIIIYMFLLIIIGIFSNYQNPHESIKKSVILIIFSVLPAVYLLENKTIINIILTKFIFVLLSALLISPIHAWMHGMSSANNRYKLVSVSYSFGKMLAIFILPLTILLFDRYKNLYLPSGIIVFIATVFYFFILPLVQGNFSKFYKQQNK